MAFTASNSAKIPPDFEWMVRDALLHVYDLAYLQTHPLLDLVPAVEADATLRVKRFRQGLLDAVEALQPGPGVTTVDRSWRGYRILESRYIEGHDSSEVLTEVSLSKSQYHREHHRALRGVILLLWERWQLADRWGTAAVARPRNTLRGVDPIRSEAEHLVASDTAGRVEPVGVLEGVRALLRPLCAERDIQLEIIFPSSVPPIHGKRVALRQALLSILAHTLKSARHCRLTLTLLRGEHEVGIRIGGPAEDVQAPSESEVDECRRFVVALKGRITLRPTSDPHGYWAIDLWLPARRTATLLVVDDNADFARLVERYLSRREWDVIGVPGVAQALTVAREVYPRVILLDVVMPGRDGWELLLDLKEMPEVRDIPVIVCSVLDEPEVAISLGASDYLQKPVDQQRLLEVIDAYC